MFFSFLILCYVTESSELKYLTCKFLLTRSSPELKKLSAYNEMAVYTSLLNNGKKANGLISTECLKKTSFNTVKLYVQKCIMS